MERIGKGLILALFAMGLGCDSMFENPHLHVRDMTEEDLNAPPNKNEVKARIIRDVRENNNLRSILTKGRKELPEEIKYDAQKLNIVLAKNEKKQLWKLYLWSDSPEKQYPIQETAFYDDESSVYFYHYEGGNPYQDVWFGPIRITFYRPSVPDEH